MKEQQDPCGFGLSINGHEVGYRAVIKQYAQYHITHPYTLPTLKSHVIPECLENGGTLVRIITDVEYHNRFARMTNGEWDLERAQ